MEGIRQGARVQTWKPITKFTVSHKSEPLLQKEWEWFSAFAIFLTFATMDGSVCVHKYVASGFMMMNKNKIRIQFTRFADRSCELPVGYSPSKRTAVASYPETERIAFVHESVSSAPLSIFILLFYFLHLYCWINFVLNSPIIVPASYLLVFFFFSSVGSGQLSEDTESKRSESNVCELSISFPVFIWTSVDDPLCCRRRRSGYEAALEEKKIDAIQTSTKYLFRRFLRFARKSFSFHSSLHCDVDFTIRHGYGYIAIRNL